MPESETILISVLAYCELKHQLHVLYKLKFYLINKVEVVCKLICFSLLLLFLFLCLELEVEVYTV